MKEYYLITDKDSHRVAEDMDFDRLDNHTLYSSEGELFLRVFPYESRVGNLRNYLELV